MTDKKANQLHVWLLFYSLVNVAQADPEQIRISADQGSAHYRPLLLDLHSIMY